MDDNFGYGSTNGSGGRQEQAIATPGITVAQYADYVKLPEGFLRGDLNLRDTTYNGYPAVRIGYPDAEGKEPYYRLRLSINAEPRFHSPPDYLGLRPIPYGVHVMDIAREQGYAILVEGESDTMVCWYCDFPALGVPGVQAWKRYGAEWATYLEGVPALLVPVEADQGGDRLWELLTATPQVADRLYRMPVSTEGYKDIGKLWQAAVEDGEEDKFKSIVEAQIWAGRRYVSNPNRASRKERGRALPTVSLREVTQEAAEHQEYFAYPLLKRGDLALLVGEAKFSGKTTLMFCTLRCVLEGEPFLGEETKKARVLYLSEQGNNLARAIEASKIDLEDEDSFRVVPFRNVWRDAWEDTIEGAVYTCKEQDREALIVDTFSAFSKLKGSEENDAGHVAARLEPLKVAAQAHDLAVVLIHHSGRDTMIRGSSAFDGTVDTIVHLTRLPGNQNENLRHIKAIGRCEPLSLNVELTEDGVYVPVGSSDRIAFTKAVRAVREVLPRRAEAAKVLDVVVEDVKASGADVSAKSVERALKWLTDMGTVTREGEGVKGNPYRYWLSDGDRKFGVIKGGLADKESQGTREIDKGEYSRQTPAEHSEGLSRIENPPYHLVEEARDLDALISEIRASNSPVAVDTETTSLNIDEAEIRLIQVGVAGLAPHVVDVSKVRPEALLHALRDKHILVHNATYDLAVLAARYGYEHEGPVSDTMLMFQVYYGGTNKPAGLKDALKAMLDVDISKDEQASDWGGELTNEMLEYAAADVAHLHDLHKALEDKIDETASHLWPVVELEHRMTKVTAHMNAVGMPVDKEVFAECVRESREEADKKLEELDKLVTAEVPEDYQKKNTKNKKVAEERHQKVNWDSPQQVMWVFKEVAGLDLPNTKADTLVQVDHPIAVALLEYRKALDVYKRFRDTKVVDGRVYAKWNQLKARTGRMSCAEPPLQGIPDPLKRAFVASKDKKLIVSDLSQIEVRVLATLSGDENLREDLSAGRDVHRRVAANVFGKGYDEVSNKERKMCKALVFGTLYGMGLNEFHARVNAMTGKRYSKEWVNKKFKQPLFAPYPKVQEWLDRVAADFEGGKNVSYTRLGRRRLQVPDVPAAFNTPIQAGATDVMKAIAVEAYEHRHPSWEIVGIVHDEILLLVSEADALEAKNWLHAIMVGKGGEVVNQGVPEPQHVKVDAGTEICDTWAEKG
jgi:DNA polymerase I-like protein with 3'-5' exonuclease and polymerase domains